MSKQPEQSNNTPLSPDELSALRVVVKEFMERVSNIDNEITALKEDRKSVIEEYKEKLDIKTLNAALKVIKIQSSIEFKDMYDMFVEVLTDTAQ